MFADPQTITINGTAYTLNKINQDAYSSEYLHRESTLEVRLRLRNSTFLDKKRGVNVDRHNAELVTTFFPVAPSTLSVIRKAYFVVENQQGDDLAACVFNADGLTSWLDASSNAAITKLMNFES